MDKKFEIAGREFSATKASDKEVSICASLSDIINYDNTQEVTRDLTRIAIDMLIDQVKDQSSRGELIYTTASVSVDINEGGWITVEAQYEYPYQMTICGGGYVSVTVNKHTLDEDYDDDGEVIVNDAYRLNELYQTAYDDMDCYRPLTEDEVGDLYNYVA